MSKLKFTLAMMAAGGAAWQAGATPATGPVTQTLNLPIDTTVIPENGFANYAPITLGDATAPQYYYVSGEGIADNIDGITDGDVLQIGYIAPASFVSAQTGDPTPPYSGTAFTDSAIGLVKTTTPGLPTAGESFFTNTPSLVYDYDVTTSTAKPLSSPFKNFSGQDQYKHLAFLIGPEEYVGTAYTNPAGELVSITYAPIPEPEAWALLIAGAALSGGMLRSRRRRQPAAIG